MNRYLSMYGPAAWRRLCLAGAALLLAAVLLPGALAGCSKEPKDYPSEGSVFQPMALDGPPVAGTPVIHNGSVGSEGSSYYNVTVVPGSAYNVEVSGLTHDADLIVYDLPLPDAVNVLCASVNKDNLSESCAGTLNTGFSPQSSLITLQVKKSDSNGSEYTLTVSACDAGGC